MKRPIPNSVCDDCINAECVWRAPSWGIDPPVMDCPEKTTSPRTHGDRIRAMSDEELAVILAKITEPNKLPMFHGLFMNGEKDVWLDWLRQEASE